MRRLFKTELGEFYVGDARKLIGLMGDGCVDAVITDPPWGVGLDRFDDGEVFFELEDEFWRVLKKDAWFVFFYSTGRLPEVFRLRRFKYVWMIVNLFMGYGSLSRSAIGGQTQYSVVMVFAKGSPKVAMARRDVIFADELPIVSEGSIGELQFKPSGTVSNLICMFTREGDVVLDPFAGYGSIPLICELFGRRWVAFEIDPEKSEIARKVIMEGRIPNIRKLKRRGEKEVKRSMSLSEFMRRS